MNAKNSICLKCHHAYNCSKTNKSNVTKCNGFLKAKLTTLDNAITEEKLASNVLGVLDKTKLLAELKEIKENAEAAIELCHDNKDELGIDYKYILEHSIVAKEKAGMLIRILEDPKSEEKWIHM